MAAAVTRAQYRRALRDARREALLSAAKACRESARKIREALPALARDMDEYLRASDDADHWDETALWLEERAEAKARA